jgi:hypothetical protein
MALRATSRGLTAAISSGRFLQLLGSHGQDIELGTTDDETEVLEKATDLVLEIALDLCQQRPLARSALTEWLSRSLTRTSLNQPVCDTGNAGRIIVVALIDLHLEHCLGVSRVDADHWQVKSLKLRPQPRGRRSCLKAYPNQRT